MQPSVLPSSFSLLATGMEATLAQSARMVAAHVASQPAGRRHAARQPAAGRARRQSGPLLRGTWSMPIPSSGSRSWCWSGGRGSSAPSTCRPHRLSAEVRDRAFAAACTRRRRPPTDEHPPRTPAWPRRRRVCESQRLFETPAAAPLYDEEDVARTMKQSSQCRANLPVPAQSGDVWCRYHDAQVACSAPPRSKSRSSARPEADASPVPATSAAMTHSLSRPENARRGKPGARRPGLAELRLRSRRSRTSDLRRGSDQTSQIEPFARRRLDSLRRDVFVVEQGAGWCSNSLCVRVLGVALLVQMSTRRMSKSAVMASRTRIRRIADVVDVDETNCSRQTNAAAEEPFERIGMDQVRRSETFGTPGGWRRCRLAPSARSGAAWLPCRWRRERTRRTDGAWRLRGQDGIIHVGP